MVVDLDDGADLGGGAGDEHLVGVVELAPGDLALEHRDALVAGQGDDARAGDALEDRGMDRRGDQDPVAHQEQVLPRAVGHVAGLVEEDGLLVPGLVGLDLGEDGVEVLTAGLGGGRDGARADPAPARHLGANAGAQAVLAEVRPPLPGGHGDVDGRLQREEAHRPVAPQGDRADVAGAEAVDGDDLVDRRAHLLAGVGQRHVVHLGRALEARQVVAEAEDRRAPVRVVRPDALEHRGAVVEAVREHVDLGVGPVDERAVHPDLLGFLHADGSLARGGGD